MKNINRFIICIIIILVVRYSTAQLNFNYGLAPPSMAGQIYCQYFDESDNIYLVSTYTNYQLGYTVTYNQTEISLTTNKPAIIGKNIGNCVSLLYSSQKFSFIICFNNIIIYTDKNFTASQNISFPSNQTIKSCGYDSTFGYLWVDIETSSERLLQAYDNNLINLGPPTVSTNIASLCPTPVLVSMVIRSPYGYLSCESSINPIANWLTSSVDTEIFLHLTPQLGTGNSLFFTYSESVSLLYFATGSNLEIWSYVQGSNTSFPISITSISPSASFSYISYNNYSGTSYWIYESTIQQLPASYFSTSSLKNHSIQIACQSSNCLSFVKVIPKLNIVLVTLSDTYANNTTMNVYSINLCPAVNDCDSCLLSNNFECGWCLSSRTCVTAYECLSSTWVQTQCPFMMPIIGTNSSATGMPFTISFDSTAISTSKMSCALKASQSGDIIPLNFIYTLPPTCGIINSSSLVLYTLVGQYQVVLFYNDDSNYFFPSPQPYSFYNCSSYNSCNTCLLDNPQCNWCNFDGICVTQEVACPTQGPISQRPSLLKNCPVQYKIMPNSSINPVPLGSLLSLYATNLIKPVLGATYSCLFIFSSPISTLGNYISNSGSVQCPIPSASSSFTGQVQVQLIFNGHPFADNSSSFYYYNCNSDTIQTCSSCINLNQPFCSWDTSSFTCSYSSNCTSSQCVQACPLLISVNQTSFEINEKGTISIFGTYWTSSNQDEWFCRFKNVGEIHATYISKYQLQCPIPNFTNFTKFKSDNTLFNSSLQIIHNNSNYANAINVYWYDCIGSTCDFCLNQGLSPFCYWNPINQTCSNVSSSNALNQCPYITHISNDYILYSGANITIDTIPSIISGSNYRCEWKQFSDNKTDMNSSATIFNNSNSWNCQAPNISSQNLSGNITSQFSIEIKDTAYKWVAYTENTIPFIFFNCSQQNSCSSCLLSTQCSWINYNTCISGIPGVGDIVITGNCPLVISITPDSIQFSDTITVSVNVQNFPVIWETYQCQWQVQGGYYFDSPVTRINYTNLQCTYDLTLTGITNSVLSFKIVSPNYLPVTINSIPFTIFDCSASQECITCDSINPSCGWCFTSASCTTNTTCASSYPLWKKSSCPYVDQIIPTYSAIGFNQVISFFGNFIVNSNLLPLSCQFQSGSLVEYTPATILNSTLLQCNVPLLNVSTKLSVTLSQQIQSLTRSLLSNLTTFVSEPVIFEIIDCSPILTFNNTQTCLNCIQQVSNVHCGWCAYNGYCSTSYACSNHFPNHIISQNNCPKLNGITPLNGPSSGGTLINLNGNLFFPGSNTSCAFGNQIVPAQVVNQTFLTCITPSQTSVDIKLNSVPVSIYVDNKLYIPSQFGFKYFQVSTGLSGSKIAIIVIFSIIGFSLICLAVLTTFLYKRIRAKREEKAQFLKLKEPDYQRIAFLTSYKNLLIISHSSESILQKFSQILNEDIEFSITRALITYIDGSQVDHLARSLIYFYESNSSALSIIQTFISLEITESNTPSTLFRASSFACKLFSEYSKYSALPYLWNTLGYYINQLAEFAKEDRVAERDGIMGPGNMEIDPERTQENKTSDPNKLDLDNVGEDDKQLDELALRLNQYELLTRASRILKSIISSTPFIRSEFRILSKKIKLEVGEKFPDNNTDYKAIGGFLFLRLICPSIMAPHYYGLLEEPPNETSQRYFVLLAKTLQNLANETFPGKNEEYMSKIDEFITKNIENLHKWFDQICDTSNLDLAEKNAEQNVESQLEIPHDILLNSLAIIQNLLVEYWENIKSNIKSETIEKLEPIIQNGPIGIIKKKKSNKKK